MTTFSLGGLSGRLWAVRMPAAKAEKRFRGKKADIDMTMSRLLAQVAEVQDRWAVLQNHRSFHEVERLTFVVARAQNMHGALARAVAGADQLSEFGLTACDADLESAASLPTRLRMEVRASAARAMADGEDLHAAVPTNCRLTASSSFSVYIPVA